MKSRAWPTFVVAAALGASVWALSPGLVGHREPWDADSGFYPLALATAGSIAGLLRPRPIWAHYVGAFAGQLIYEALFLPIGPLFVLGIAFLLAYSAVFLAAAAAGGCLAVFFSRIRRPS